MPKQVRPFGERGENQEKMTEYYEQFKRAEEEASEALKMYADLVFNYGVELDSTRGNIDGVVLFGVGSTLRHLCAELDFAQAGREQTDINLNKLAQGEDND
ncbi:hypothetical protein HYE60_11320 [Aggregatibacter actinomycetemcomitans]|nr:hypothetical protein [Aggregatibacter actinomycetemcomitans]